MQTYRIATMHIRASYNGILVSLETLTPGKQQQWLEQEPPPQTKTQTQEQKRVKRLIKLSREKESE